MAKKEDKPFVFPPQLLSSIDECSAGGFLLFVVGEQGDIQPFVSFSSEVVARALTDFSADFAKSLKEINNNNILGSLAESFGDEDDEDFGDPEL